MPPVKDLSTILPLNLNNLSNKISYRGDHIWIRGWGRGG